MSDVAERPILHPRSQALWERARATLPGGSSRSTIYSDRPIYAASAQGPWIRDVDGRDHLDFINNYTSLIHGHAHPEVVDALRRQAGLLGAVALPTETEILLAEEIVARSPALETIRFANSGTEAVMLAVKAARAFTGRPLIAKIEGAYHGALDAVEVSLDSGPGNWGEDRPSQVPYCRGTPDAVLSHTLVVPLNDIEGARRVLEPHAEDLSCILVDLVPSRAGLVSADPAYLRFLREFVDGAGALLIADEVISFRVGFGGAQVDAGLSPDLTTLGKIIGGGLPVGAVAGRRAVMDVFNEEHGKAAVPHGGTFNANPLTMAAGLAAMRLFDEAAVARLNARSAAAVDGLRSILRDNGAPAGVVSSGSLFKIRMSERQARDYRSSYLTEAEGERQRIFAEELGAEGLLLGRGLLGALSTVMSEGHVEAMHHKVESALRRAKARWAPDRDAA